jgi:hypothetical protein
MDRLTELQLELKYSKLENKDNITPELTIYHTELQKQIWELQDKEQKEPSENQDAENTEPEEQTQNNDEDTNDIIDDEYDTWREENLIQDTSTPTTPSGTSTFTPSSTPSFDMPSFALGAGAIGAAALGGMESLGASGLSSVASSGVVAPAEEKNEDKLSGFGFLPLLSNMFKRSTKDVEDTSKIHQNNIKEEKIKKAIKISLVPPLVNALTPIRLNHEDNI